MEAFLTNLGLGHVIEPMIHFGLESFQDLELAVRILPIKDLLRETGITPFEWITIRRAYFTSQEWCQPSFRDDDDELQMKLQC